MKKNDQHHHYMSMALAYGQRAMGQSWPNPAVGCVLVCNETGQMLSVGWTQPGGRPHAEQMALAALDGVHKAFTAYVSLEPCTHYGQTPPCMDLLIKAGMTRLIYAASDPNPDVQNNKKAPPENIDIAKGQLEEQAIWDHRGFISSIKRNKPWVTAKLATTLDGKIATKTGESQWITNSESRQYVHFLRSKYDAILENIATVKQDNPLLTCRLPGLEQTSPVRVILDRQLEIDLNCNLVQTVDIAPLWLFVDQIVMNQQQDKVKQLQKLNIELLPLALNSTGHFNWDHVLTKLKNKGITRLFCEPGSGLMSSMMQAKIIDELWHFQSNSLLGNDAMPMIHELGVEKLADQYTFKLKNHFVFEENTAHQFYAEESYKCLVD